MLNLNALELFSERQCATIWMYTFFSIESRALWALVSPYRRLSSSADRSNFMSLSYFFWLASCMKWIFITWFRNLVGGKTAALQICSTNTKVPWDTGMYSCAHLSMVPNSQSDSLLKGISMLWKWAKLVAISTEMIGSDSCSVRRRRLWGNSEDLWCWSFCFWREHDFTAYCRIKN